MAEQGSTIETQIKEFEDELTKTKYNKKTQHHIGLIKAKIALLKEKIVSRSRGKGKTIGYDVRKTGDGSVVLIGFPSVGKSTLLNKLTNAKSEVAAYAFTTLTVIPGLMEYKHAKIQLLDVPGIVTGAASGKGRGREVLAVMRSADLALIIIDVNYPEHFNALKREIFDSGIRSNQSKPEVVIKKKAKDGVSFGATVKLTKINKETVISILKQFRVLNADVVIRDNIDIDQFIDSVEGNKVYMPAITILSKIDMIDKKELEKLKNELKPDICVSAEDEIGIEELRELIYKKLNIINVYCKDPGKPADLNVPLVMFQNCTIRDMCNKLHKSFVSRFKFARIWGKSAKFEGQKLMLNHNLKDKDIVELHLR